MCAKTAETIEMSFGLWSRMVRRKHVLDGGPKFLRDVGFVGYDFRCMIASDTLFDSRGGFSW